MPVVAGSRPVRIYAVVVLYKRAASDSATLRTLLASAERLAPNTVDLHVLLYDNTPGAANNSTPAELVTYHAARANNGLAGAYNKALDLAENSDFEWLLTLDQDTELLPEYLSIMAELADAKRSDTRIAAIVPHLVDGTRLLSPVAVGRFTHKPLPLAFDGVPQGEARALNSGALLRVAALHELGGFHPLFWLNYLDNWLHHALYQHGKSLYVARDLVVQHELSLLDYRGRMTLAHYSDFLLAESAFHDLNGGWLQSLLHTAQLAVRLWNQHRRKETPEILAATRRGLAWRLTRTRKRRLREWSKQMELRTRESGS